MTVTTSTPAIRPSVLLEAADVRRALARRLATVAGELEASPSPSADASELLSAVVSAVRRKPTRPGVWLVLLAVGGRYADPAEVDAAQQVLASAPHLEAEVWLLSWAASDASEATARNELRVVTGTIEDVGQPTREPAGAAAGRGNGAGVVPTRACWRADRSGLRFAADGPGAGGSRTGPNHEAPMETLLVPSGAVVLLTDFDAYDAPMRSRASALLADAPCAAIGYDRPVRTADPAGGDARAARQAPPAAPAAAERPTGAPMEDESQLEELTRDAAAWRDRAVAGWLLAVAPAPAPFPQRAWRKARRELALRVVAPARAARARRRLTPPR